MQDVLVSGVVALDHIVIGDRDEAELLGGSASFASLSAAFFSPKVHLHAVVGNDFPSQYREVLASRGILMDGLETLPGKTFRWCGKYDPDNVNNRETVYRELNVLDNWEMTADESLKECPVVDLASATSRSHVNILGQVRKPRQVLADTMD